MNNAFKLKAKHSLDTAEDKKQFNLEHFTESAARYDFATRALSLWQDHSWKKLLVKIAPALDSANCLDLACGTGDVTFLLAEKYPKANIIGTDITPAMLEIARKKNQYENVDFETADIAELNYPDQSFDLITGSYALRNSPDIIKSLHRIYDILKPGSHFIFLDFAKPESKRQQKFQYYLLKFWGSLWGILLHGNPEVHGYISASLQQYPPPSILDAMIAETGFSKASETDLFFGMLKLIDLKKE